MKIEMWPIDRPIPYARNPRRNQQAVDKVAASLKEFGWRQPIVVDEEGVIIVGHTRLLAAQKLGMTEVPVHVATGLTPAQVKAYRLADNRSSEEAEWNIEMLGLELAELSDMDFNLDLTAFDAAQIGELLASDDDSTDVGEDDGGGDPPAEPETVPGELIELGRHRLLCGDSTNAEHVGRLLDGATPRLMVTDPPYGVSYDPEWRENAKSVGHIANDDRADWSEAWALFPGEVAYVWHASLHGDVVKRSLEAVGFVPRYHIIWAKPYAQMSRGHYNWQHEPCWMAVRDGATAGWLGPQNETTLWSGITPAKDPYGRSGEDKTPHPTQKPVECMARPIRNHTGDVYDPFAGSGSTLIACEGLGRTCYAMELDPRYCDVIVARWEKLTGKKSRRIKPSDALPDAA